MTKDPQTTIHSRTTISSSPGLPHALRIALWASPLVVLLAYVAQASFRFPHLSRGAGLTALAVVVGVVLGGATALFGYYQFLRRPRAWSKGTGALLAVNTILLLVSVAIVPNLLR
jgi:hypothetical protein